MKFPPIAFVFFATLLMLPELCLGQDPLAKHQIKGLKGIRELAVVVRFNTPQEIIPLKEWGDMVEVGLHQKIPELKQLDPKGASAWFEVNVITTDRDGFLELSMYRWVKVLDSGDEIFSKVWWDSRLISGGISKKSLQESLDVLLTSFAADYFRAKR